MSEKKTDNICRDFFSPFVRSFHRLNALGDDVVFALQQIYIFRFVFIERDKREKWHLATVSEQTRCTKCAVELLCRRASNEVIRNMHRDNCVRQCSFRVYLLIWIVMMSCNCRQKYCLKRNRSALTKAKNKTIGNETVRRERDGNSTRFEAQCE